MSVSVGKALTVQKSCKAVADKTASSAIDNCTDLQAGLEQLITHDKIRAMMLSIFVCKPNGLLWKLANG